MSYTVVDFLGTPVTCMEFPPSKLQVYSKVEVSEAGIFNNIQKTVFKNKVTTAPT